MTPDAAFEARLAPNLERARAALSVLYGHRPDFEAALEAMVVTARDAHRARPAWLRTLDEAAADRPDWFLARDQIGAIAYTDRFAGDLAGLKARTGHLKTLGVTYLHLMPLLAVPEGEDDGGYAVADYRRVRPDIGTMEELSGLAQTLWEEDGIRLCLDFVVNHTADTHPWAEGAKAGREEDQRVYWMFDDREMPDRFQPHLREIFPERGPIHFHHIDPPGKWVWTTFHPYQWDLNFSDPETFRRMLGEMLFLANAGALVLRLDAVPFLWKRLGTNCENQPEAHLLIQAFNAFTRIAAPALLFKSEAIVHPDEVARYVGAREAQLSYHPLLMVCLWEALATRDTKLLRHSFAKRFALPPDCGWVNYVRCHDDIGWGFADEDAAEIGIDPHGHRAFLNAFYHGTFRHQNGQADFAQGLPFGVNPRTGDARVSGSTASLAGLERAVAQGRADLVDLAVSRILLLYGVLYTIGGLPLINLGDEVAALNDYGYRDVPEHAADSRWVHRPCHDWDRIRRELGAPDHPAHRIYHGLAHLAALRRDLKALDGMDTEILSLEDPGVLGYRRSGAGDNLVVLGNFTETSRTVGDRKLVTMLGRGPWRDRLTDERHDVGDNPSVTLAPYQLMLLERGAVRGA